MMWYSMHYFLLITGGGNVETVTSRKIRLSQKKSTEHCHTGRLLNLKLAINPIFKKVAMFCDHSGGCSLWCC